MSPSAPPTARAAVRRPSGCRVAGLGRGVHFKSSVEKETAQHFFRVRLWNQADLISQILEHYDRLDEEIRAELPLKRIWTVAAQEEE